MLSRSIHISPSIKRLKRWFGPPDKARIPSWIRDFRESDAWLLSEVLAVIFAVLLVVLTVSAFWFDLSDRKQQREILRADIEDRHRQRIAQSWDSVTRAAPGNSGKGPALEFLNNNDIPLVGIDLSSIKNHGQNYLAEVNLPNANLQNASLAGADLRGANLSKSNLKDADLSAAELREADLSNAQLQESDLSHANLVGTNMAGAILWRANLEEAVLIDAFLSNAKLENADLSNAELTGADLHGADLTEANFTESDLWNTQLVDANFTDANLSLAKLSGADFKGARLQNTDLSGAELVDEGFQTGITPWPIVKAINLSQVQLNEACGDKNTRLPKGFSIKPCN